ncbi:unnamed protein product [Paramecium sonneborni]|uniref:Uncharacterized protein n=1 Tax=Paramecium sonneborni TaxID=65129 RepID=A0A8S1RQ16_9CILI|nr:unnamed protein product [Paramecium sonneborni]
MEQIVQESLKIQKLMQMEDVLQVMIVFVHNQHQVKIMYFLKFAVQKLNSLVQMYLIKHIQNFKIIVSNVQQMERDVYLQCLVHNIILNLNALQIKLVINDNNNIITTGICAWESSIIACRDQNCLDFIGNNHQSCDDQLLNCTSNGTTCIPIEKGTYHAIQTACIVAKRTDGPYYWEIDSKFIQTINMLRYQKCIYNQQLLIYFTILFF